MLRYASLAVDGSGFSLDSNLLNLHKLQVLLKGFVSAASNVLKTGAIATPNKNGLELGRMAMGKGWFLHVLQALLWGCIVYGHTPRL